jgi:hypothetical protein
LFDYYIEYETNLNLSREFCKEQGLMPKAEDPGCYIITTSEDGRLIHAFGRDSYAKLPNRSSIGSSRSLDLQ